MNDLKRFYTKINNVISPNVKATKIEKYNFKKLTDDYKEGFGIVRKVTTYYTELTSYETPNFTNILESYNCDIYEIKGNGKKITTVTRSKIDINTKSVDEEYEYTSPFMLNNKITVHSIDIHTYRHGKNTILEISIPSTCKEFIISLNFAQSKFYMRLDDVEQDINIYIKENNTKFL